MFVLTQENAWDVEAPNDENEDDKDLDDEKIDPDLDNGHVDPDFGSNLSLEKDPELDPDLDPNLDPELHHPDIIDSDDVPDEITDDDIGRMQDAFNYWHTHGYPEKAAVLYECIQQRRRPPSNLLPSDNDIRPETSADPSRLTIPDRAGKEATVDRWRAFAKKTLDVEPEIIDAMGRKDLIGLLESKNVIPREDV